MSPRTEKVVEIPTVARIAYTVQVASPVSGQRLTWTVLAVDQAEAAEVAARQCLVLADTIHPDWAEVETVAVRRNMGDTWVIHRIKGGAS